MIKRLLVTGCTLLGLAAFARAQNVEYKNPPELNKPTGYTQVVIVNHGKLIFIAGQVGTDKDDKVPADFGAQARQAFINLKAALAAAGATPANLVKINYYVVALNHDKLVALRQVRDSMIDKEHPPASTLAGVQSLFREDVQLEMDAEAVIP